MSVSNEAVPVLSHQFWTEPLHVESKAESKRLCWAPSRLLWYPIFSGIIQQRALTSSYPKLRYLQTGFPSVCSFLSC